MKASILSILCFFYLIMVVSSFPVIYDKKLGQLAIPVLIAGGFLGSAGIGVLAGALASSKHGIPLRSSHHG